MASFKPGRDPGRWSGWSTDNGRVHRRHYDQADPPGPVTCLIYLLVALFLLGTSAYILHLGGLI